MKKESIGGHVVQIYDSIDELPIKRFHKYNKFLLVDSGIGSDINDLNQKISIIIRHVNNKSEHAITELENMRQSLYLVSSEINPSYLAFSCLVYSIDGQILKDISDDGLRRVLERLNNTKVGWLNGFLESIKKKITEELNLYFPGRFDSIAEKEYYDKLRERVLLMLDSIINETENEEKIRQIDNFLLTLAKPHLFSGKESAEIKFEKEFDEMCLFLTHKLNVNPDEMNVLQFYNSFEYLQKSMKQNKQK
ncbi:MAG: hypothetical protein HQ522_07845 [Bacteroidetes bacterium]|nr:hypothetical protein [Bacteroidota bacterium]